MNTTTLGALTSILLSGMALPAAIIIEDGLGNKPTALDGLVLQTYGNWSANSTTRSGSRENRDNAQTFVLDSAVTVDSFILSVNQVRQDATVTFRLFEVPGSPTADPLILGTEILSEAYTFSAADATITSNSGDATTEDNLLTWDISNTLLSAGNYALQIDDSGLTTSGVDIGWRSRSEGLDGPYAAGMSYRFFGEGSDTELNPRGGGIQDSTLGIVAIPEPTTLALTLVCGMTAVGMARRRKH